MLITPGPQLMFKKQQEKVTSTDGSDQETALPANCLCKGGKQKEKQLGDRSCSQSQPREGMEHTAGAGGANEPPVLPKHTAFAPAHCEAFLCCSKAHLHPFF